MGTKFKNPSNEYMEEASSLAWLWVLLFGPLYFGVKGVWPHAIASLILALITFGFSHFIYFFFANSIIRKSYLKKGWIQIDETINVASEIERITKLYQEGSINDKEFKAAKEKLLN